MKTPRIPLFVYVAVCLVAVLSLFSIWRRYRVESENRSVGIAAEYETVEALAGAQGLPVDGALRDLKAQGLSSVVLSEETIGGLISQGKAIIVSVPGTGGAPVGNALRFTDTDSANRVRTGLSIRFGALASSTELRGDAMMLPPVSPDLIRSTAIGLNPSQAAVAKAAGLEIIARCSNPSGANAGAVRNTLAWAHQLGASVFLPQGDQVLGRREALDTAVTTMRNFRPPMLYATPEFAKIGGDTEMVEAAPDIVVRLHTAQTAELDKLTPIDAVERYSRAARERNMRILLVRPLTQAAGDPLFSFNDFVKKITSQLLKHGQVIGQPHAFHDPGLPAAFFPLLGVCIGSVVWWAVARFVQATAWRAAGGALLLVLALACFPRGGHELSLKAQELMALLGSMAFPFVAFLALEEVVPRLPWPQNGRIFASFWIVSAISLVGGLCVAGMLNGLPFYVKAAEFVAVKVSVFLPILAIGIYYFIRLTDWKGTLASPMTWGASALGLCLGAVLALMLARTGNDTGVGPSGGEMVFRNVLDRVLFVRPRTKEFLIGHPIMMIGIGLLVRRLSRPSSEEQPRDLGAGWTVLALMLGAIGQTSIVNTLCHLHIPVVLSFARIAEGLVLGSIIGIGSWVVISRALPAKEA